MVDEINLGLFWKCLPAQEEAVAYVLTPKVPVDSRKQVIVFADCSGSYHNRKPLLMRTMLFPDQSFKLKQTVVFPPNVPRNSL